MLRWRLSSGPERAEDFRECTCTRGLRRAAYTLTSWTMIPNKHSWLERQPAFAEETEVKLLSVLRAVFPILD